MPANPQLPHAWRGALVSAALNATAMPLDIIVGRHIPDMPWWPPLASSLVGLSLCILLLVRRRKATVRLAAWCFGINTLVILATLWVTNARYASSGSWVPFQAQKLGTLAAPLLTPTLRAGLLSIVGYVGSAIVQYEMFDPVAREHVAPGEAWVMLIYGLFGAVLLVNRLRELSVERTMLRTQMEGAAAERLTRTLLAVRDHANTPLQSLELGVALMRSRNPDCRIIVARMERALARLRELNGMLAGDGQPAPRWAPGDESFDSAARLRERS